MSDAIRALARRAAVPALATLVAALYFAPAFEVPGSIGWGDWAYFHHMWEVGVAEVLRHGALPLWDRYQCGGVTLWGDPQAQLYGPWFLLAFALGPTLALKVGVVAHAAVGLGGAYRLAREAHQLDRAGACAAAICFALSGYFAWHMAGGHAPFAPFYLLPVLALSVRRAADDSRYVAAVSLLLALTVFEGGVYPLSSAVLVVAFESFAVGLRARRLPSAIGRGAVAGALFALIGAARLAPIAVELGRHPRPTADRDSLGLGDLADILLSREHTWEVPGHPWVWAEYSAFVGVTAVALALAGFALRLKERRLHAPAGALLFGLIACGSLGWWSPWELLHHLPVFDSLRVPSRVMVVALLYGGVLAGAALDALARLPRARTSPASFAPPLVSASLVAVLALDIGLATRPVVDRWTSVTLGPFERGAPFELRPAEEFPATFVAGPRANRGTLGCYVVLRYTFSRALRAPSPEAAHVASGDARVGALRASANEVTFDADVRAPARVVINRNHAPDWTASVGALASDQGRLAVDLPPGRHRVALRFAPATLRPSVAASLLGLAAAAIVATRRQRRGA